MILGSIYGGITTVREAAAVGVLEAAIGAYVIQRLSIQMLNDAMRQTMIMVGTSIWLVLGP